MTFLKKRKLYWILGAVWVVILRMMTSCAKSDLPQPVEALFVNAHVVTMDPDNPEAEAFAVEEGRILAVGSTQAVTGAYVSENVIDLQGQTVFPGIIESHGHLLSLGRSFLDLNLEGVRTPEEAIARVEQQVSRASPGEWIMGWGWDEGAWASQYPDHRELSRVSPDNPVYLRGLHGFAGWANAKALEAAGINGETPNPENGEILKDLRTGEPTGILTNDAQELLTRHIPPLSAGQTEKALELALEECLSYGLTTVHEARTTTAMLEALRAMKDRGALKSRVYVMIDWTDVPLMEHHFQHGPELDPDHFLTVRCLKIFVDGALGSRGAAMLEPYSDAPGEKGLVVTPRGELTQLIERSLQSRMQVAVHAIGDRANRLTADALDSALQQVPGAGDIRFRLEHAQVVAPGDIPRFAPLGVVLSMQPPHAVSDMPWAETRVGPERIKGAYAWRSFLETGVHMTLNSDFPGEDLNPFFGMYAAMTRQTADGFPDGGWYPEQCLTREEVLRAYTVEAAYSEFSEEYKGKIAPGMLADFIILSADITSIAARDFLELEVLRTYVGGRLRYQRVE